MVSRFSCIQKGQNIYGYGHKCKRIGIYCMLPYKFIVPTQGFLQNHPGQGGNGKDNRPFKLYLVFVHDPCCCLKVSSIVRVCSDSTNLPDNSALSVRSAFQCPVPSQRTLRHSCTA